MSTSRQRLASSTGGGHGPSDRLAQLIARTSPEGTTRIGRYSAFVGVMRFALPLIAVLLLGLVVIWPLVSGREEGFRVTYASLTEIDGSLKMIKARYIGTDGKGQPFTLTADEALQAKNDPDLITLKTIVADMFAEGGAWLAMTANSGIYRRLRETLDLEGAVSVYSDEGQELHTERAHIDIKAGTAHGDVPVLGQGPFGLIEGTGFEASERGAVILLKGRVKATIYPKSGNGGAKAQ